MAGKAGQKDGRGVIQLLEEAVHLLRRAPRGALACYCIGALPFVMAVMYFWADMSRSALAHTRLTEASLTLSALFIWMKCWQSVFAAKLHAALCGHPQPQWTSRRIRGIIVSQTIIQPWGLIVLPIISLPSNLILRPGPYAFFQNVCVLAGAGDATRRDGVARVAWRQAALWPKQNILAGLVLTLFGLFVFINIIQAILLPPFLLKTFLNVDTVFSRGGFSEVNTTFLAITLGLTYLCLDPIIKAFYTLRCFYGASLASGQDLQADLRRAAGPRRGPLVSIVIAVILLAACAAPAVAEDGPDTPHDSGRGSVKPKELDKSLDRVISRTEYTWRMRRDTPPSKLPEDNESAITRFFDRLREWIEKLKRRFESKEKEPDPRSDTSKSSIRWAGATKVIVWILLIAVASVLVVLVWITWRKRRTSPHIQAAQAASRPDLEDEDTAAEDLPEHEWLEMARELMAKGEGRLALRAMYLASLASLAQGNLISLARFKSNRDYYRELRRRAHSMDELHDAFGQNVTFFEDAWYGMHEVTEGIANRFEANQQRICDIART